MAKFMALHTYKKPPEEVWKFMDNMGPEIALAMANGETPAKCISTWNPFAKGRSDYVFCLWEADKLEAVEQTLRPFEDYLTWNVMPVDEIDWAAYAKSLSEKEGAVA